MFYKQSLPKAPSSASEARDLLERLRDQLVPEQLEDARLLMSEVVANAIEHVREDGDIEIHVELSDASLRVDVHDPGPGFTHVPRSDRAGDNDRGWGLVFAERIASRWGNGPGLVWFELDRS